MAEPRIRLGMVGGGEGAFIGAVHRIAARLDDRYELIAGALSASPDRAMRSAAAIGLPSDRSYPDFRTMAQAEAARTDGIEAVAIVTPNHMHAPVADAFLDAGIHIICDKPLTTTLEEARRLRDKARASGLIFAVTYNYSGYPLVRHARAMVQGDELGAIRIVQVEYPQDWLADPLEATGQKQADWRTDPARAGAGGCVGDIGTHAYQLAHFVTGMMPEQILAETTIFVPGRRVDDNVQILLRYKSGARGALWASQVAPGNENGLRLRIFGEKGGLDWRQKEPNLLVWSPLGEATRLVRRGARSVNAAGQRVSRTPPGHPEGYLEAFATIYTEVAAAIVAGRTASLADPRVTFPTIEDGFAGVAMVDAVLRSSAAGGVWMSIEL
ncbi:Gfo/Idh/MocA family oxidoreductase [Bradyrhizobium sp. AUGA SZCCT0240]|uniref:Gfo/Idh/MocA family protein n=2 Tax=Bradyrhizobium TaxID=374 RepID=UPI001BA8FA64|nr:MULTISPECIES: Gfo/Idh/MocA family oxidoreductase [unclassified Bradyrhizobium]MBR1200848.1 Gfo/Idh/MocA family oxidoreductase [Bradyrhizobium sp. AUGA SZCCT0158]MBR1238614.1 Gfo/Idh/MocA family oxidoreductase [Bradyrhizobium sp. AUGA SZCCT0274]MBR1256609.1 Gfo/Idh/MocA family oxidoreductase [Bradyrhizobium sp. AUGA SZCCT0240]